MTAERGVSDRWQRRSGAVILAGTAALLLALTGRLAQVHTAFGPRLSALAQQQRAGNSIIPAQRGTIVDARGRVLATSRQKPDVFVDPLYVEDVDSLAGELSARLDLPFAEMADKIRSRRHSRFVVIARSVDEAASEAVRAMHSPAVGLTERAVRTYPLGGALAHVLGFVGRDGHGLEGLELAYDDHLSGRDGRRSTIRDARRRALWPSGEGVLAPVDGGQIVLTIDAEVQRIAHDALADAVAEFEAQSGVAVIMSPADGRVLAMVNVPTYDPHNVMLASEDLRRNRVVTDPVEPGSTFKPFIACGALDGGFVSTVELIDCGMGSHRFGRRLVTDVSPHGMMNVLGIVAKSSNVGMGMIAARMGNEALHDIICRFGFGRRTQIGLPGESAGVVFALGRWTSYSTTSVSFGYELGVTPLQLATAFSAIINDGVLLRPRLVARLLSPEGHVVRTFDSPQVVRRVVSSDVARYMTREVFPAVVESGSGRRAGLQRYRVLGKTGTAKLPYADRRGYESGAYLGTFIGAAPAEDPQAMVLVVVRRPNPARGYYGGTVAAPAVGAILEATLDYLEVPPGEHVALADL
ncbi:MAG: peptidoglycan D,D-transpeptidase FtsI family protein [Planctomycetota bacterium]|jgi:cell division protein FtsI (penicillin-binding protein 3)